jgi:flagellin
MKVNHNISAVISNSQLLRTESNLTDSIERLSSGLRINNAKDDPAGLAISNKMQQQINGIEQANRNAQNATSALNTADGALNEVTSILQRMRELSVQAANDTNTQEDKQASQAEIDKLVEEVDRISKDTEYNSQSLLDGTMDTRVYGKNVGRINISDYVATGDYKVNVTATGEKAEFDYAADLVTELRPADGEETELNINGYKVTIEATDTDEAIKEKIRTCAEKGDAVADIQADGTVKFTSAAYGSLEKLDISYKVTNIESEEFTETQITGTPVFGKDAEVTLVFKNDVAEPGSNFEKTATVTTSGNRIKVTDKDGFSIDFLLDDDFDTTKNNPVKLEVTDMGTMEVQVGANEHQLVKARIPKISSETLYLDTVDVTTMAGPDKAMDTLDDAIAMVSDARSKIGAYTNRLDYSSSSLAQTDEDLTAAFSRIKDIDMATEMTTYANQQVLQQAGTSVLAQANDIPQQVLQLLQ